MSMMYNKDDAMHIAFPPGNPSVDFEWWYFDAAFNNGEHFVCMYSTNDTRLQPRQPSVRTNIYCANGDEIWECKPYKNEDVTVSYERCDARFGDEYCIDCGDYYELYTYINGNGAKLKFYPVLQGWSRPADPQLMGWTIAIPQGRVEGELYKGGSVIPVKGIGYHDHNWGHHSMGDIFKNWYWGKIHTDDFCVDYGIIIPKNGEKPLTAAIAMDKDGMIFSPDISGDTFTAEVSLENISQEPEMGYDFAKKINLKVSDEKAKIEITIDIERIVMREKAINRPSESVYRYIGKEVTKLTKETETKVYNTSSLHEIVYLEV